MTIGLLFLIFAVLLFWGVPIGISIGLASICVLLIDGVVPLVIVPQKMFIAVNSFTLLAIPFFMLTGVIMDKSGITGRLVDFANAVVGWLRCGMCYVSVFTGMLMGGISGSAPADTAALSSVMIPSMNRLGYPKSFAAALQAAAGAIGIIIPPSIPMVVLGGITGVSVGALFVGGIIPGVLIGLALMGMARLVCARGKFGEMNPAPFSLVGLVRGTAHAVLPLMAPIIIIGGILSGVFTPTESSIIAVVFTLFVGMCVYKTITFASLKAIFAEAAVSSANVMLIIAASSLFSWILTRNNFPAVLSSLLTAISDEPWVILLFVNLIFFVGGMFIEGLALIIMFVPILMPIALSVGADPILFCIMIVINIAIGTLTPPVGVCLFVASSSAGIKLEESSRTILPFITAMLVCLALVIIVPGMVTFLPSLM